MGPVADGLYAPGRLRSASGPTSSGTIRSPPLQSRRSRLPSPTWPSGS